MSKAYDLKQKSNLATTASHFKSEPESVKSNSGVDSVIQSALKIQIEKLEGRQRRVFAKIHIPYPFEQVWQVLTDYEAFVEFMPSLTQSRRLEHPTVGVRIEQVRTKNFMGMNFSARSVFDIEEKFPHSIHYQLIEGDMKAFSGYWRLEPCSLSESKAGIDLIYDFFVSPKRIFPMALVEHILSHDIPANMLIIRQRVEEIFG
jgi:ribosome-associated toxin RatA of RatAB toxin-antitoxin module